ncbi:hypothetical protein SH661x_003902 [Planctomicrobium sp. SH661]|uniref:hypothetical protein n=1 Tax=Planctomicrobium sp. SH661 TaxID=3448124 RepID=UPI003F5C06E9
MSGWFSKAANVFKPDVPEASLPFVHFCFCGEELRGLRKPHHQQLVCKVCQARLFILPRDVYPAPLPAAERPEARPAPIPVTVLPDEEQAEVVEANVTAEPPKLPAGPKKRKKQTASEPQLPTLAQLRQRIRDAEKPKAPPKVAAAEPQRTPYLDGVGNKVGELGREARKEFIRFWTPFRILTAAVLIVMLFTGAWMVRQSLLASAARIAQREGDLGMEAVRKEEWTVAREHLQRAAVALERLGRSDPESQTIRQYARETEALFRLSPVTLEELLSTAQTELAGREEKEKSINKLASAYYGDWMLLEGTVEDVAPQEGRRREFVIRLPADAAGKTATLRVNFPVLNQLIPKGEAKPLIIAGALTDCAQNEKGDWVITLDSETGFLWGHLDTYKAIGFGFNPVRTQAAVEAELREQTEAMGVTE